MVYLSVALGAMLAVGALYALRVRRDLNRITPMFTQRTEELELTRDELTEAVEQAREAERRAIDQQRLAESLQVRTSALEDELQEARSDLEELNSEVEEADTLAEHQSAELASMAIETEELSTQLAAALKQAETNRQDACSPSTDAATLWHLELARSERSWRYSVALYPDDTSPFTEDADLLRLAVETEASALRDEVGAYLTVDWHAGPIEDLGRAHLVLRVAQELLARAARLEEPSVLRVAEEAGSLVLTIAASEEGDQISLDLREFESERFTASGVLAVGVNGDSSVTVDLVG
mgnify:CR=1 FL=1